MVELERERRAKESLEGKRLESGLEQPESSKIVLCLGLVYEKLRSFYTEREKRGKEVFLCEREG